MRTRSVLFVAVAFLVTALSGCLSDEPNPVNSSPFVDRNNDGQVVVAVVDSGANPYHFDMIGSQMPQHLDADPTNDLPLDQDPSTWVRGYPEPSAFASYSRLDLTITDDPDAVPSELYQQDAEEWSKVQSSSAGSIHMSYIPNTKMIGWITFGGGDGWAASSHGVGTSSVSVGNIHGSCPECLLVMVDGLGEQANRWVEEQDWIDVQTNSWGYASLGVIRDRIYTGSDTASQLEAVERGQAIFFSAGNGLANTFTAPNPTLLSSQEGPDWIVTVGAIAPGNSASYTGHGKPAIIASLGSGYPSAGGGSQTAESTFGGTSNATPVTAGMYAKALWLLRQELGSVSVQENNVIATGAPGCGGALEDCALADGAITYQELRDALLDAARHTDAGYAVGLASDVEIPATGNVEELTLLAEGAGSLYGRFLGDENYQEELDRIVDLLLGDREPEMSTSTAQWLHALSTCRQSIWGTWDLGHDTLMPDAGMDPTFPVRTFFDAGCPTLGPMLYTAADTVTTVSPFV